MDEQEIKNLIKQEIDNYANKNRFNPSLIPYHEHTGVESPRIDGEDIMYSLPYFVIPNSATAPTALIPNAIVSVAGVLYICDGASWIKVGTQS